MTDGTPPVQAWYGAHRVPQEQIEPQAGTWKTWVLTSGSQLQVAPPPDRTASTAELQQLKSMAAPRDEARASIAFWDTGAPGGIAHLRGHSLPSDVDAGLALGRSVAAAVVDRAQHDAGDSAKTKL